MLVIEAKNGPTYMYLTSFFAFMEHYGVRGFVQQALHSLTSSLYPSYYGIMAPSSLAVNAMHTSLVHFAVADLENLKGGCNAVI